jgi:hypothetical protein
MIRTFGHGMMKRKVTGEVSQAIKRYYSIDDAETGIVSVVVPSMTPDTERRNLRISRSTGKINSHLECRFKKDTPR